MSNTIDEIKEVLYETKFADGTEITDYTAIGIAEGFEDSTAESENEIAKDTIRVWSYICGKRLYTGLQGWFGRNVHYMIDANIFDNNGKVNWNIVEEQINS